MIDWQTTALVVVVAAMFAFVNYLGLSRAAHRQAEVKPTAYAAIEALERSLASQAARMDGQSRRIDELEAAMDAQERAHKAELADFREELEEAYQTIELLTRQLVEAQMVPVVTPKPRAKKGGAGSPAAGGERDWLVGRIVDGFNLEELENLAFDVGINAENLHGETLETRARELVKMAGRMGKRGGLEARVNELRPRL